MPIVDYKKIARLAEEWFFSQGDISGKNKEYVKKKLDGYDVSDARKSIFLKHIVFLLRETKDIMKDMQNRDKTNKIFKKLREKLTDSYYATVVNVSLMFVTWLNDSMKPKGFKDLKNVPKSRQRRDLNPKDMIAWEEGQEMADMTTSIQLKAVVLTQLDAGFRPSEFVDLKYADVKVVKNLVVIHVNGGKTGARDVILHRSVPAFLKWYHSHSTKSMKDPLWVMENIKKSHPKDKGKNKWEVRPYEYRALAKRVELLGEKAGIEKPLDFYNFRHSSCFLDKLDNLPLELAAERHGHSVEFFTKVYGRMDVNGKLNRTRKHYGLEQEERRLEKNIICSRCDFVNEPNAEFCFKCGAPLTIKKAIEMEKTAGNRMEKINEELKAMRDKIMQFEQAVEFKKRRAIS